MVNFFQNANYMNGVKTTATTTNYVKRIQCETLLNELIISNDNTLLGLIFF